MKANNPILMVDTFSERAWIVLLEKKYNDAFFQSYHLFMPKNDKKLTFLGSKIGRPYFGKLAYFADSPHHKNQYITG